MALKEKSVRLYMGGVDDHFTRKIQGVLYRHLYLGFMS